MTLSENKAEIHGFYPTTDDFMNLSADLTPDFR